MFWDLTLRLRRVLSIFYSIEAKMGMHQDRDEGTYDALSSRLSG